MEESGHLTPRPLYLQGKSPWYPLDRSLSVTQSRSEGGAEEKNSQPPTGIETPIIQPITQRYTTDLSRFLITINTNFNPITSAGQASNLKDSHHLHVCTC
jgi:hypothetical protein